MEKIKINYFNKELNEFVDYMINNFNEDEELISCKMKIYLALSFDEKIIYNFFKDYILEYRQKIIDCDENFLVNELTQKLNENNIDFINFPRLWNSPQNNLVKKTYIFQYLIKMVKCL